MDYINASMAMKLVVVLPLLGSIFIGVLGVLGAKLSEVFLSRFIGIIMLANVVLALVIGVAVVQNGHAVAEVGPWYKVGDLLNNLKLICDNLSAPLLVAGAFIISIVGYFASRYLHRDPGYFRFFVIYALFAAGYNMIVLAGTLDILFIGWEFVGISSILLIGFFQFRARAVASSFSTLCVYRICDIGLIMAVVLLHHDFGSADLTGNFQNQDLSTGALDLVAVLIVFASLGKAAQLPFSFWLPRAIEGPTPSSAVFYGALSVHMGPYLLLRMSPLLTQVDHINVVIVVIGLATAAYGAFIGRTRSEVKTILAYASMCQVGLIFAEIGFGWYRLALFHTIAHMLLRTLQFLQSPMAIQNFQSIGLEQKRRARPAHLHIEMLLPEMARLWLYRMAIAGGYVEDLLKVLVARPFIRIVGTCGKMEERWLRFLNSAK